MTPEEREEKIISMMQKMCIFSLTSNLFESYGVSRLEQTLDLLNEVPVDTENYSRFNSTHAFLHQLAVEYLEKTKAFIHERNTTK